MFRSRPSRPERPDFFAGCYSAGERLIHKCSLAWDLLISASSMMGRSITKNSVVGAPNPGPRQWAWRTDCVRGF